MVRQRYGDCPPRAHRSRWPVPLPDPHRVIYTAPDAAPCDLGLKATRGTSSRLRGTR